MRGSLIPTGVVTLCILLLATSCLLKREDLYDKFSGDPTQQGTTTGSTPGVAVDIGDGLVTSEDPTSPYHTDSFSVVLNTQPTASVTIGPFSSGEPSEVTVSPVSLTFTTSNWDVPQWVTVIGEDDTITDGLRPVLIDLGTASGGDYGGINPGDVTVHNLDDDVSLTAEVVVIPGDGLVTREHPSTPLSDSFQLLLSAAPASDVTVGPIASTDTNEVTVSPSSLTFTPTDWGIPQTVTVTGVDDPDPDGMQAVPVDLGSCTSADPVWDGLAVSPVTVYNLDDDKPKGITVAAGPGMLVSESGGFSSFQIVLDARPSASVTIPLSSSDPSEGTISAASLVFTTTDWFTPQVVTVTGVDDFEADGTVSFSAVIGASASSDSVYSGMNPPDVQYRCVDDDAAGVTVLAGNTMLVTESGTSSSFTVVLNSRPGADVGIHFFSDAVDEGTVLSPAGGTVTFTSGTWSTPQTVTIGGVDDAEIDGDQPFHIKADPAVSTDGAYSGLLVGDVNFFNVDNDKPGITVKAGSSMLVSENGGSSSFSVVLGAQPAASVSIPVSVSDPGEGTLLTSPTLSFDSGNWSVPQTVTVVGVDDAVADGNKGFTAVTGAAVSADPNYSGMNPPDVTFVNVDDDTAGITVYAGSQMLVHESGTPCSFTVVLSSQPSSNVDIPIVSNAPDEGVVSVPASGTLSFTSGNWSIPQTVTVSGVDDGIIDGNQPFTVTLGPASSADPAYSGLNPVPNIVSFTCIDTAPKDVMVFAVPPMHVTESGFSASFQVVLTAPPSAGVDVAVWSNDLTEGTVSDPAGGILSFTTANWNIPKTVTVSGADDLLADGDQPFTVVLDAASSADPGYAGIDPADVAFTTIDDETAGIIVLAGPSMQVHESGTASRFSVVLSSEPSSNVTVGVSSTDATEGSVSPTSLVFTSTDWSAAKTVTVTGVDDYIADGNVSFFVNIGAGGSSDPVYNGLAPIIPSIQFMNVDDESFGITVNIGDGLITKEDSVSPTSDSFTIVLNSEPLVPVAIGPITSSDPAEVIVAPANLTFDPANWDIPQTVTVTGVDDLFMDDMRMATVDLGSASAAGEPNYDGLDAGEVYVYNLDDEQLMPEVVILQSPTGFVTSENGARCRIQVVLNSQPTADVNLGPVTSDNPLEGTVDVTDLTFTTTTWNQPQTVTVNGVADGGPGDGDVWYTIDLGSATSADPNWDGRWGGSVTVVNLDFRGIADLSWSQGTVPWTSITGSTKVVFRDYDPFDGYLVIPDEGYEYVPIGFSFYFLGVPYDRLTVYTNGVTCFNPYLNNANSFANALLFDDTMSADLFVNVLAPWWDDLNTATGAVWYRTTGFAPNRVFVLEFENAVYAAGGSDDTYSFQIRLYEGTNTIEFVYGPMSNLDGSNNDTTASVGIKGDRLKLTPAPWAIDGLTGTKFSAKVGNPYINRKVADFPPIGTLFKFGQP